MKLYVCPNTARENQLAAARHCISVLENRMGAVCVLAPETSQVLFGGAHGPALSPADCDLIVSIGGDGAVLRADTGRITVGAGSNVQDNAVLHTGPGLDVVVGRNVSIGHSAVVHGCTVGDDCLIGMHATILNGAVIGAGSLVAAGALVTENAVIPAGSLVVGVPGKVVRTVSEKQKASIAANGEEYRHLAEVHAGAVLKPSGGNKKIML